MNKKLVEMEIDLTEDEFLHVAKLAHEQDITFNEMVTRIIYWYTQEKEDGTSND